jgi:hypothetical protein
MADEWRVIPVESNTLAGLQNEIETVLNIGYVIAEGSEPQVDIFRGIDDNFSAYILFYGDEA